MNIYKHKHPNNSKHLIINRQCDSNVIENCIRNFRNYVKVHLDGAVTGFLSKYLSTSIFSFLQLCHAQAGVFSVNIRFVKTSHMTYWHSFVRFVASQVASFLPQNHRSILNSQWLISEIVPDRVDRRLLNCWVAEYHVQ